MTPKFKKNKVSGDIKEYLDPNDSVEVSPTILWDALKNCDESENYI